MTAMAAANGSLGIRVYHHCYLAEGWEEMVAEQFFRNQEVAPANTGLSLPNLPPYQQRSHCHRDIADEERDRLPQHEIAF
jgi:hypothetical protein